MLRKGCLAIAELLLLVVLGSAGLFLGKAQAQNASAPAASNRITLTGSVACAAQVNHLYSCKRNETRMSCAIDCVQEAGSHYVLLSGSQAYELDGAQSQLEGFAGGAAQVSGVLVGNRIEAASLGKPAK